LWRDYLGWLKRQRDPLFSELWQATGRRSYAGLRYDLFRRLDRRQRRILACDCTERVLPIFERRYSQEQRPRQLLETMRKYATGRRVATAKAALEAVREHVAREALSEGQDVNAAGSLAAWSVAHAIFLLTENLSLACTKAAHAAVIALFGPPAYHAAMRDFRPEWLDVLDAERRWQIARLLCYRFGFLACGN